MMDRHSLIFWSLPIFRAFGTDVRVSWMLPLLAPIYMILNGWQLGLALFASMVLAILVHEFSHVFGARLTGGSADEIVLWPLGGLAMAQPGPGPKAQFLTAAAGPFVNLVLCGLLFPSSYAPDHLARALNPFITPINRLTSETLVTDLCLVAFSSNYVLLLINLLPVIPFDGGQMLHAALSSRLPADRVFRGIVFAGFFTAVMLMVLGLLLEVPGLIVVGAIVLAMNLMQSSQGSLGEYQDESFMGYDFSQGYTSLERTSVGPDREPQPSGWQRWKERRKAQRDQAARERQQQDEAQLDALLAKVHEQGFDSLTAAEKRLLHRVSTEYRQRTKRPS